MLLTACSVERDRNRAPVPVDKQLDVAKGGLVSISSTALLAGATDPDGDSVVIDKVPLAPPQHGTLISLSDGEYQYVHDGGEVSSDSFSYQIKDSKGATASATVTIAVDLVNDGPPVANDDSVVAVEDMPLLIDVTDNDLDPDGAQTIVSAIVTGDPANGTATPVAGGGIRYVPAENYSGSDSFFYKAVDNFGAESDTAATVTVTVNPVNDPPVANDDGNLSTAEDTVVNIAVAANDSDVDGSIDGATIVITTPPGNGTATPRPDGTVDYQPASDFSGTDSFQYTIKDDEGAISQPATVTVAVTPVNDAPVAVNEAVTTAEDVPVIVNVTANDTDVDGTIDKSTVVIVSGATNGAAVAKPDGTVEYTPDANFYGSDAFTYTVQDSDGATSNVATVSLTITSVNDLPVANGDSATVAKNVTTNIDVVANDTDADGNSTIVSVQIITSPAHGTATVKAGGTVDYTPAGGYSGSDSFTYKAVDDNGASSAAAATVAIVVNTPPTAIGGCSTTRQEVPLNGTLNGDDPDGSNSTLTFALGADGSAGTGPMPTTNGGSVRIIDAATGSYTYTPPSANDKRGSDSFPFQVKDSEGATASATERVIVDLRIMPLGDSITDGAEDSTGAAPPYALRKGYRQPLYSKLGSYGYGFDFVGGRDHGNGVNPPYDYDAEGWGGYTAYEIADGKVGGFAGIYDALDVNPADIILLHIGTNDITPTTTPDPADIDPIVADVEAILDEIDRWEQQSGNNPVTVVLARIINQWKVPEGERHPAVTPFNDALLAMVQGRTNDDIIVVSRNGSWNYPGDMGDDSVTSGYKRHPNTSGYSKMADVWLYPLINQGDPRVVYGSTGPLLEKCD
ncbi:MAG TPA: tandem-95 repeat protein [Gammaproteobacteria bacterium]|nr:tandem-95 repeat protein [Gammaproteobacteria bacterium]